MNPTVLCCYSDLHPRALDALRSYAPTTIYRDTSGHELSYGSTVMKHWRGKQDLIIIEQDIAIGPETIESLISCSRNWCLFSYASPINGQPYDSSMGCTKYSAILQRDLTARELALHDMTWHFLDEKMRRKLMNAGYRPHVHGQVDHHHKYGGDFEFLGTYANEEELNDLVAYARRRLLLR